MTTPTGKHASVAGKEAGLSASDSEADVQPMQTSTTAPLTEHVSAPLTEIHQRESKKITSPTGKDASVAGKEEGSPPPLTLTASTSAEHEVQPRKTSTRAPQKRRDRTLFSLTESTALVQAVEELGPGSRSSRWVDVKNHSFKDSHRTPVDLKDKWITLLHTASLSKEKRRGPLVPQELLDRVEAAESLYKAGEHIHGFEQHNEEEQPEQHNEQDEEGLEGGFRDIGSEFDSEGKNIVHPSFRDREITVHMAVGRFLFGIGADFDAVNSANFQPMIDAIASGGFGVSSPTSDDLRGWIPKNCVEETTKEIDECRAMWKRTGCSVLVEEVNNEKGLKVLNFLVYCPEKVVFLKSVDASEVLASSADRLVEIFREVVEEIGHASVVQVITKCDDHYVAAGKQLMHEYPSLYWVPCAANCIDEILEEFGKLDWIRDTIEQARAITRFVYNRSDVLNLMRKFTSGNDILQPGFSTSATDFGTLCRIAELQFNLQAMVTSPEWNECSYSKEPSGLAMNVLTDEAFWKTLTLVNHLTAPLLRLLRIVCSEKKPAMGYVYAAMYRAKEAIKTHLVNREDYIIYWRIIDQWWEQQQHVPMHAAGFFLNPKFFYNANEEMRSEISAAVLDCIERLVPVMGIQEKIVKELNSYKNAAGVFGRNLAIRARDTMLPAEWWSTYGESCLNLSRFAIRILSQTCSTSVGCRRNQIPVEQIYQSKNSIEQKRLSDLAFVQYNMRLKQLDPESGDDTLDPLSSHSRMDVLKAWVSRDQACVEENGSSDWKLLESVKRTQLVPIIDETDDLGSGFDDIEIFKVEKEVRDEGYYTSTNTLEKVFT